MRYECYDCGERFNEKDMVDQMFLTCPYCDGENVEDLENELL